MKTVVQQHELEYYENLAARAKPNYSEKDAQGAFLAVLRDYFVGEIPLSYIEAVALDLTPRPVMEYSRDLDRALLDGTEVFYYSQHGDPKTYEAQLRTLRDYYERHKHLL